MVKINVEGKTIDYQPKTSAMYRYKMMLRIHSNPSFRNCFKIDVTQPFLKDVVDIANSQNTKTDWIQNLILQIYGETGCQPRNSKVLMSNGSWKNIQDVTVGDSIISFDKDLKSKHSKVLKTMWFHSAINYDIKQIKRHQKKLYSCSYNHIIPFFRRKTFRMPHSRKRRVKWVINEMPALSFSNFTKRSLSHRIMGITSPPIQDFKKEDCFIEPYCLGVFLGDGHFVQNISITTSEKVIVDEVKKYYPWNRSNDKKGTKARAYLYSKYSEFARKLMDLGLEGKKAGDKFIPEQALFSSLNYRKRLLAGLIDTDSHFGNGGYTYTSKSKKLVEQIEFLVHSVGGRVNQIKKIKGTIKSINFEGIYWSISFFLHENLEIPVLTERRIKQNNSFYLSANRQAIEAVKRPKGEMVYGFTLDSDTGYYITDNYMLTHNSSKSMSAVSLGVKYFKNFSANNVMFFDQQILDNSPNFPPNSFVIRDENSAKGIFGVGSTRTTSQTQMMAETCRKYGLSLCLIEPSFVINPIAKYYLSTIDVDVKNRVSRLGVQDPVTLKFIGSLYLKVIDDDHPVWVKYNDIKDAFIASVMNGQMKGAKLDYENMVERILNDPKLSECKTKKERKSLLHLRFPTYTTSEINVMVDLLEMELRK